jgi:acetyl-CoA synthetase
MTDQTIESVSHENRIFPPPEEFALNARVSTREEYEALYRASIEDPEAFWLGQAEELAWFEPPTRAIAWDPPKARFFEDGTINVTTNCLDRHIDAGRGDRVAILWEGEPGEVRRLTYRELAAEVNRVANLLRSLGAVTGDRVGIYMGMVPEVAIAMLACARLGLVHTVIFGGFAGDAIRDRLNDAGARFVITQDGAYRRGKILPLKPQVDAALSNVPSVEKVIVLERTGQAVEWVDGRDVRWSTAVSEQGAECAPVPVKAEHPLFILYTSGTTGKPKGVLHATAGYLLGVTLSARFTFDLKDDDVYWCTADVGWITGHSYIVYGPLANGATVMMYEGAPNQPDEGRFWDIVERHGVTILYTAPTAIRAFIRWGDEHPKKRDLTSLRLLGSVGEPINPEAWVWYHEVIGGGRCPIVDTWWQTETGAIMMTPLPGAIPTKPGSCCVPFFGVLPKIVDEKGNDVPDGTGGFLIIERPWPSMLRTVFGDDERYRETYFGPFPGRYFTGDGARRDKDGYFWVMGRVDDVVNVSGHRLGTAEIESSLVSHPDVAEAAVVGRPDELKGQALVAFVTVKEHTEASDDLAARLCEHVAADIGRFARPEEVRFAPLLPKTRSGKIMRRILKALAAGQTPEGDVTTLEDPSVLAALKGERD